MGEPAHGGSCVARHGRAVVFVRHALPGELVTAVVTKVRSKMAEADACRGARGVARPGRARPARSPDRDCVAAATSSTSPPRPSGRGSRRWCSSNCSASPASTSTCPCTRSPTRTCGGARAPGSPSGRTAQPGLHRHHSHEVLPLDDCPITHADAAAGPGPAMAGTGLGGARPLVDR